jgi:hypothetical protein
MVDEVIVIRLRAWRRREVDAVLLARLLHDVVGTREPNKARVEVLQVPGDLGLGVACGVDGDENWLELGAGFLFWVVVSRQSYELRKGRDTDRWCR